MFIPRPIPLIDGLEYCSNLEDYRRAAESSEDVGRYLDSVNSEILRYVAAGGSPSAAEWRALSELEQDLIIEAREASKALERASLALLVRSDVETIGAYLHRYDGGETAQAIAERGAADVAGIPGVEIRG